MVNQLKITTTFLLLALLVMALKCDDDYPLEEFKYNFEETVDILPVKKSYKLGDTIWIKYQNSDKRLHDAITKQDILTDSVSLGFNMSFEGTYYSLLYPPGGHCEFITSDRNIDQASSRSGESTAALRLIYGCANTQSFEAGVVLKQRGNL
ncbi:hypothetical protein SAMN05421545_0156 [Pontibacter lucknowensis]|uniref:Uncharacterized protein n=1 Tax=Pontibacter lucknowensis TaxID=1077936 RepID=A0A1N6T7F8_9BACT|nr:hypothetical protein SAMN05421545_0156 [Pontibacter lucknowensis]